MEKIKERTDGEAGGRVRDAVIGRERMGRGIGAGDEWMEVKAE